LRRLGKLTARGRGNLPNLQKDPETSRRSNQDWRVATQIDRPIEDIDVAAHVTSP
jgi:hypothetical protein